MPRRPRVITGRQWAGFNTGEDVTVLAAGAVSRVDIMTLILADLPSLSNWTVLRVIGSWSAGHTGAAFARVAFGLILQGRQVAITGMSDPVDEPHADWLFHDSIMADADTKMREHHFDVRGMRRGRELETGLWAMTRNQHTGDSVQFSLSGRVLLGLH